METYLDNNDIEEIENKRKVRFKFLVLILLPIIVFLFSMTLGRYSISVIEILKVVFSKITGSPLDYPKVIDTVIFQVRIPRILVAMIVGSSLSISGAVYQGMFKNPMVSPDILGTSAGAGFGATLGILLSFNIIGTQLMAFAFGLLAVFLIYTISLSVSRGGNIIFVFILAGILIGTVFQSFISLSKYIADPYDKLPTITFWLMGSLANITSEDLFIILIPFVIGVVPIFLIRWNLNTLSFGEEEAKALGIDTRKLRFIAIVSTTILTASSVSVAGMVGWVGLIVPHIARMIVGPDFKKLIPATALIGSTYLLLVDNIARTITTVEIPLGILTSLLGAPFFIYLLYKTRRG